jgi:hypothetical protein
MKEKILEVLREHPNGLRAREIAMYLHCNHFALLDDICDLREAGLIDGRANDDHANGEYYIVWFLVK